MKQRSTIRWHGEPPTEDFTIIPNELARDGYLSSYARSIALYVWSHRDGFKISTGSIATYFGISKTTAAKALNELIEHGWLTRIELTTETGRVFGYRYYADRSRRIKTPDRYSTRTIKKTNIIDDVFRPSSHGNK